MGVGLSAPGADSVGPGPHEDVVGDKVHIVAGDGVGENEISIHICGVSQREGRADLVETDKPIVVMLDQTFDILGIGSQKGSISDCSTVGSESGSRGTEGDV